MHHPIASALSLIGVMGSIAVLYLLLSAEFIAMVQIIVYAGAVMVLFVFVIMLLNSKLRKCVAAAHRTSQILGVPALIALWAACLLVARVCRRGIRKVRQLYRRLGGVAWVSLALFTSYLLPFEVTSVLILIAIVGAIVLARKEMD